MLDIGKVAVAVGRDAILAAFPRVGLPKRAPPFLRENGGFAMMQSKVAMLLVLESVKAGLRSKSSRAIRKSSIPCRTRFIQAMAEVVKFFS